MRIRGCAVKVWAETNPGCVRGSNEDAVFWGVIDGSAVVLAVADGMGGHEGGEIASHLAIEAITTGLCEPGGRWEERLRSSFVRAHALILSRGGGGDAARPMGTTMTCAIVDGPKATIGHVGDSRAYVCRDGHIRRLTADHSLVGELEMAEGLTEREAMVHPHRHILTRALGVGDRPEPDIVELDVSDGDVLVLCTDGLTSVVTSDEIGSLAGQASGQPATRLIELANARGGPDNITVIVAVIDSRTAIEVITG